MFFRLSEQEIYDSEHSSFDQVLVDHITLTLVEFLEGQFPKNKDQLFPELECFALDNENEILFMAIFRPKSFASPVSFFLSWEIVPEILKSKTRSQILIEMGELCGNFLIDFANEIKDFIYSKDWVEHEFQNLKYFAKTSREDIRLTIEANKLLR
ncbi:MAG: hypothetical protein QE271_13260 [Bacteriovoracaceae bacterium]|nr:hypothetical protein [Bacteriovoracaceae bacterium]